jgi:UDP-glucuronate 4-epimerase
MRRAFITGTSGFIGFHLAQLLLDEGCLVHGYDGMTDYYDVTLKHRRHAILHARGGFSATIGGVAGVSLSKTSVSAAADAPALAALWNANAYYRAFGVATVGGSNDVVITGNAYSAITFTDTSTGANSITPSTTTALVAPTARAIPGARFRVSSATKTVLELA